MSYYLPCSQDDIRQRVMSTELNNSQGEKWQNFLQKKGSLRPLYRDPYTARVLLSPPQQTLAVLLVSQEHLINLPQSHSPLKADLTYHANVLVAGRINRGEN